MTTFPYKFFFYPKRYIVIISRCFANIVSVSVSYTRLSERLNVGVIEEEEGCCSAVVTFRGRGLWKCRW